MPEMDTTILAMGTSLLWSLLWATTVAIVQLPRAVIASALSTLWGDAGPSKPKQGYCTFYEGEVYHERKRPVRNEFRQEPPHCIDSLTRNILEVTVGHCFNGLQWLLLDKT